jgi:hypothetical protein
MSTPCRRNYGERTAFSMAPWTNYIAPRPLPAIATGRNIYSASTKSLLRRWSLRLPHGSLTDREERSEAREAVAQTIVFCRLRLPMIAGERYRPSSNTSMA